MEDINVNTLLSLCYPLMIKSKLTFRAPNLGYVPRYSVLFAALGFSRFDGESTLPPQAGNASRWAIELL